MVWSQGSSFKVKTHLFFSTPDQDFKMKKHSILFSNGDTATACKCVCVCAGFTRFNVTQLHEKQSGSCCRILLWLGVTLEELQLQMEVFRNIIFLPILCWTFHLLLNLFIQSVTTPMYLPVKPSWSDTVLLYLLYVSVHQNEVVAVPRGVRQIHSEKIMVKIKWGTYFFFFCYLMNVFCKNNIWHTLDNWSQYSLTNKSVPGEQQPTTCCHFKHILVQR